MKVSKQARRDAKQLFRSCLTNGLLDENRVRQTVQFVIQRKPRGYVGILSHFQRRIQLEVARRTAKVESATALTEPLQANVRASLNRLYGAGLSITFSQNPTLIGGLRVRVGSDVYDGSIQARLAGLEDA